MNLRHIILITIGDKEDSKQSQQMQAGVLTERFNLYRSITLQKQLGQVARRFQGLSLSVSYKFCLYNVMITIFAKFW